MTLEVTIFGTHFGTQIYFLCIFLVSEYFQAFLIYLTLNTI
nr:MAG TPA: hypothetical protein [Caudoviricetes sp.]